MCVVTAKGHYKYSTMGIAMNSVTVVTVNAGTDITSVHPSREELDRQGHAAGMNVTGSEDIEAPRLVPRHAREEEEGACTCERQYIPSMGNQGTEFGQMMAAGTRKLMGKQSREKGAEGGNSLPGRGTRKDGPVW